MIPSLKVLGDASLPAGGGACAWCDAPLSAGARSYQAFCTKICRQRAFRIRKRLGRTREAVRTPLRMAYADPPYPRKASLYRDQPSYAGEVDHAELIASLADRYDGWALSTGAYALREVLPLCPPAARVCAWVKPIGVWSGTYGIHNCWEPVIVVPGRALRPGKRDWLSAQCAKLGGSTLIGRKPEAFCTWLFGLLGLLPGDTLDDLYPGTGIVTRAWREVCRKQARGL